MSSAPLLETRGLSRQFGRLRVLTDFDLAVEPGEVLGIIGPNGAGKTTLLGIIGGSIKPSSGQIILDGKDVTSHTASWRARKGVATSYQVPRPFGGMTVLENALVAASFAGGYRGGAALASAMAALEGTGLEGHANARAESLRLLDRKRLELARALAARPRLLLLDEIAGGLTESEVPELVEMVRNVSSSGVTVIWIEHVVHALTAVATRLLCLTYGEILAVGKPDEVLASPRVRAVYLGLDPDIEVEPEARVG